MPTWLPPLLLTAFAWWGLTGLIAWLDWRPQRTFRASFVVATGLAVLGAWGLWATRSQDDASGAYLAFASTLAIWGWIELSFLMGFVTGPRQTACPADCRGLQHFRHAVEAILWHELLILAVGAAVVWGTLQGANSVGAEAFLILWVMRTSAKLNLFLGVRNLGVDFLPPHLRYLAGYFRQRPMNSLLPFSLALGGVLCLVQLLEANAPAGPTSADITGPVMLATLAGLAVVEHLMMVLPIPPETLWRWSLREAKAHSAD